MLDLIASLFKTFLELIIWVVFILACIIGYYMGKAIGHPIIGAMIGLIVALIFNVLYGGLVSVFLRIDSNIKLLVKLNGGTPNENTSEKDNISSKKDEILNVSNDKWVCSRCKTFNEIYLPVCKKCGAEMNDET